MNDVQRSAKRLVRVCEKFVPALVYLYCLALPGSCLARFAYFSRSLYTPAGMILVFCLLRARVLMIMTVSVRLLRRGEGALVDAEKRDQLPRAFSEGAPPPVVGTLNLKVRHGRSIHFCPCHVALTNLRQSLKNDRRSWTSSRVAAVPDSLSSLDLVASAQRF